jgi:hypothetical protein
MFSGLSPLRGIAVLREYERRRESSWDRTGGNRDFIIIQDAEEKRIAETDGKGVITHLWMTTNSAEEHYLRKVLLRITWDREDDPSVLVPLGDFFGMGHGLTRNFVSLPLTMSPRSGRGMNCYFPMPFYRQARIEVINEGKEPLTLYYYVDYELHSKLDKGLGLFHAQWCRENPTTAFNPPEDAAKVNQDGKENYVILRAQGRGHYVGCNLNVDCGEKSWYGEGDDMIFIDGDEKLTLHGTGTEDYFNCAYSPNEEYCAPYHGYTHINQPREYPAPSSVLRPQRDYSGKTSMYRFHIEDPVTFKKSIRVTIEHGHANARSNDYSSTAYWYQTEPHRAFNILPVEERIPNP